MSAYETLLCASARAQEELQANLTIATLDLVEVLVELASLRAGGAIVKRGKTEEPAGFAMAYDAMKEHGARWLDGSRAGALAQWKKRVAAGADPAAIHDGVVRYALHCKAVARQTMMAQTFFGPGLHYEAEWSGAGQRQTVAAQPGQRGKFNFAGVDRAGDLAAQEATERRLGLAINEVIS